MGKLFIKGFIPILILAAGFISGAWFIVNPDEAQKRPKPEAQALLVETDQPESGSYPAHVEAMGQVRPAMEIELKSLVSGEIVQTADEFVPGGFFKAGDMILSVDPADYELAVKKQEAILLQAQADYDLEMGRQSVAKDEMKILERTTGHILENPDLALRKPQLTQAQAELDKAKSDLDSARLDLARTKITAPFNALVVERQATQGDKINAGETLASLVSTDEYWVEVSLPVSDLSWIDVPVKAGDPGSPVTIFLDNGRGQRKGHVARLTGSLDQSSRLATVLVSVEDPLGRESEEKTSPLILGDYVRARIEGQTIHEAVRIPHAWLRDGNVVWVKDGERLAIHPVKLTYEDIDYAYINDGIDMNSDIITSDISVPVDGMKVRTVDEARGEVMEKMNMPKGLE